MWSCFPPPPPSSEPLSESVTTGGERSNGDNLVFRVWALPPSAARPGAGAPTPAAALPAALRRLRHGLHDGRREVAESLSHATDARRAAAEHAAAANALLT